MHMHAHTQTNTHSAPQQARIKNSKTYVTSVFGCIYTHHLNSCVKQVTMTRIFLNMCFSSVLSVMLPFGSSSAKNNLKSVQHQRHATETKYKMESARRTEERCRVIFASHACGFLLIWPSPYFTSEWVIVALGLQIKG